MLWFSLAADSSTWIYLLKAINKGGYYMQIFVRSLEGKKFALEVEANDTIRNVEAKIFDQTGLASDAYALNFGGNELDPDKTLADYNIQKESTLNMVESEPDSPALCFLKGTRILTSCGYQPIESIRIGDLVSFCSLNSEYRAETFVPKLAKVKWVAKKKYLRGSSSTLLPLRIAQHAFAPNCPSCDLYISACHSIVIDDALIRIGDLYNGITITNMNECCDLEYFHLEFDEFGFVYANGLACESYYDDGNRKEFDNSQEYWDLYPNTPVQTEKACAYYLTDSSIECVRDLLCKRAAELYRSVDSLSTARSCV